jgi:hypothetical protein
MMAGWWDIVQNSIKIEVKFDVTTMCSALIQSMFAFALIIFGCAIGQVIPSPLIGLPY